MPAVRDDRSVLHDLEMLAVDHVAVAGNGDEEVADLRGIRVETSPDGTIRLSVPR